MSLLKVNITRIVNAGAFMLVAALFLYSCKKNNTTAATPDPVVNTNTTDTAAAADGWYLPVQYRNKLKTGIDVDWAKTSGGMAAYSEQAVINFKARGISHVRIRVANDMSASLLDHIDRIVKDCINHDLIPVIAYQADAFKNDPVNASLLDAAVNWWGSVADRFKNYSPKLSFDLLIECSDALNNNNAKLNEYMERTCAKIRTTNPKRILFISPRKLAHPDYLKELVIPTMANGYLLAESHFYAAGPSKTNANKLWTTGTTAEKKMITDIIDTAYAWQTRMSIPVWVGAWMPADYDGSDNAGFTSSYTVAEQVVFAGFVSCQLRKKNMPYAVNSDTKFYDRNNNSWYTEMAPVVDAFLNPLCP